MLNNSRRRVGPNSPTLLTRVGVNTEWNAELRHVYTKSSATGPQQRLAKVSDHPHLTIFVYIQPLARTSTHPLSPATPAGRLRAETQQQHMAHTASAACGGFARMSEFSLLLKGETLALLTA